MGDQHDRIARHIAKQRGGEYNAGQGPDVKTAQRTIEVEVDPKMFDQGMRQLQGFSNFRYLAVPDTLVQDAIARTDGTKVGVMNSKGEIVKRATAPKKK